ncbi:hypothetical protein HU727_003350 [Pseudomonas sp. SWRI153]|uniref:Uncharacterized protein n=1 Tax=Pseudomonas khorasanensis TaxID=2745508 RepID=A0A923JEG6_9PSED|nr:hypothetical protein [Pseudomonas khorasanensis]
MVIACLGWGSLIWKPDGLPLASEWFSDGPHVPVEFARVSDSGELTTAICVNGPPCKVLWAVLDVDNLDEAREALRLREGIPQDWPHGIGSFTPGTSAVGVMAEWAIPRELDAVIWTALPPRFKDVEGLVPTANDAVSHLAGLSAEAYEQARNYVEQVPAQIDTPYRREIISRLGWK